MSGDPRWSRGERGERLAEAHLKVAGYDVIARNFRTAAGELDLVATGSGCIVFCEVRTRIGAPGRTPGDPGGALESIGPDKRRRLRRMAREWLTSRDRLQAAGRRGGQDGIRFDAIGVVLAPDGRLLALEHVENAF
jgi:putative endonuclease